MDDTDLQILSHLQRNGRLTMVELGKLACRTQLAKRGGACQEAGRQRSDYRLQREYLLRKTKQACHRFYSHGAEKLQALRRLCNIAS